jgi:hypothetical protein
MEEECTQAQENNPFIACSTRILCFDPFASKQEYLGVYPEKQPQQGFRTLTWKHSTPNNASHCMQ